VTQEFRQERFKLAPGATHVYLVRHGESAPLRAGEPQPLMAGHGDPPLDTVGHEQAELVAGRLAGIPLSAIYVSSLQRTAQTAAPLSEKTGIELMVEPDLREVFLGEWEGGLYRVRAAENHPDWQRVQAEQTWDVIPGAEKAADLAVRVGGALNRIAARHPDERVAVFAHGGVIGMLAAIATGGRMFAFSASDNGSITHLVVKGDTWRLRGFNDTYHLGSDLDFVSQGDL
jgi:2,3-bisphosphoglycerate-dependent phosphoglycerate mutase